MKKVIVILCAVLTIVCMTVSVSAATSASISLSADNSSVGGGDKVTITVKGDVDQCGSGGMEVSFDTQRFELISGAWLLDGTITEFSESSKNGVFAFSADKKLSGNIFKLVIKVKDNAPLGAGKVSFVFQADRVSASKSISINVSCSHQYSNKCDTTCDSCGATRKITHSWNKGDVTKEATCTATGTIKYTCTVCGETKSDKLGKADHAYDHACDTGCNNCGAEREITHALAWTCDSTEHWMACAVCGYEQDRGAHTLDTVLTGIDEGHGILCTTCNLIPDMQKHTFDSQCDEDCADCGYQRVITHYYGATWHYDTQGHWQACALCGLKTELQEHTTGQESAEAETTDGTVSEVVVDADLLCTTCGFIVTPAPDHVHMMDGNWISDETGHRFPCRCGSESDVVSHNWDEGQIDEVAGIVMYHCTDCDYARAEIYIPEPANALESFLRVVPLWVVLSVFLGISVIANVVLTVVIVKNRRRAKDTSDLKQEEPVE